MATTGLGRKYQKLLRKLLPSGWAWQAKDESESEMSKLLSGLSEEFGNVEKRSQDLLKEIMPNTTIEMIDDWERLLGLPDECSPDGELTLQERRDRVLQVLTTRGGQNEEFYRTLASNFGFDIDVISVSDQPPFRVGSGRVGDRLTNGSWRYAFIVQAPSDSVVRFRVGQSRVGEPLLKVTNDTLECLMQKYKPAHSIAIFSFGEY